MGAVGLNLPGGARARAPGRTIAPERRAAEPPPLPLPLLAFAVLGLLAGMRFAALLAHPPAARVAALVAGASACAAGLAGTRDLRARRGVANGMRVAAVVVFGYVSLRVAGAPARELWPWHPARLGEGVARGLDALDGLWPYRGRSADARTTVMFGLAVSLTAAAALAFWPVGRLAGRTRAASLGLLLAVYATAVANQPHTGWRVQGMLLLGVLALWALAWMRPPPPDLGRAAAWVLAIAVGALAVGGLARSSRPLIDYRQWNPFGVVFAATSFDWNQGYGPIPWSRSNETMVEVTSAQRRLLRATTLDSFDGIRFMRSARQPPDAGAADAAANPRWLTRTAVTVRGLSSAELLGPGAIISAVVAGPGVPRLAPIAGDGTLAGTAPISRDGTRYEVTAYAPRPGADEMRAAPARVPAAYLPYTRLSVATAGARPVAVSAMTRAGAARIEASPYAPVLGLARRLATGEASRYDRVAAVEAFLGRGFRYDETPPRRAVPLVAFLLRDRAGYCQQFSGAMPAK